MNHAEPQIKRLQPRMNSIQNEGDEDMGYYRPKSVSRDQKKELVNILIDSGHYLDMDLAERNRLLHFLMDSYLNSRVDEGQADS